MEDNKGTCNTNTNVCECDPDFVPNGDQCVGRLHYVMIKNMLLFVSDATLLSVMTGSEQGS